MTSKEVNTIVMRVLLELYGTMNFAVLNSGFQSFSNHLSHWYHCYMQDCSKGNFVRLGLEMLNIIEELFQAFLPDAIDVILRRLELETIVEPCGLLQTLFELALIRRNFNSRAELLFVFKSCERARNIEELQIACNHQQQIAARLWCVRESLIYGFVYDVIDRMFKRTRCAYSHHSTQLISEPLATHLEQKETTPAATQDIPLQKWCSQMDFRNRESRMDKERFIKLQEYGLTLHSLAKALRSTHGSTRIRSESKNKTVFLLEAPKHPFAVIDKLHNYGITLVDIAKYIKYGNEHPMFVCILTLLFVIKLKARVKLVKKKRNAKQTPIAIRQTIGLGALLRVMFVVRKFLARVFRRRKLRELRKLAKKKCSNLRKYFRKRVLDQLLKSVTAKKTIVANVAAAVCIHKSQHTIAGIVRFWRKLGRLQAIKRTILDTPNLVMRICEKVDDFRVNQFLFTKPESDGYMLYWEFRFALHMLKKIHSECWKILGFLRSKSSTNTPIALIENQEKMINTLINPFQISKEVVLCAIGKTSVGPMVKLVKYLRKRTFIDGLRKWIRADPVLYEFETCLPLFSAQFDIFANMQQCFERIPFSEQKILFGIYYGKPKYLSSTGAMTFYKCKDAYTRFKGAWQVVQSSTLSECVDNWLENGFKFDILSFMQIYADAETFVAEIEQGKKTPDLKQKLKQRQKEIRHK